MTPRAYQQQRAARGFTLIEILVAIAVFAVVAAMAYGGLNGVMRQRDAVHHSMQQLKTLQQGFSIITSDLSQAAPRPVRVTVRTLPHPALTGATQNIPALVLTRDGWANPLGENRATLQRVAYKLDDDKLVRLSWPVLDRSREMDPLQQVLFDGVDSFRLRFLDDSGKWQQRWPPLNVKTKQYLDRLPTAVEVTIDFKTIGEVGRVVELP